MKTVFRGWKKAKQLRNRLRIISTGLLKMGLTLWMKKRMGATIIVLPKAMTFHLIVSKHQGQQLKLLIRHLIFIISISTCKIESQTSMEMKSDNQWIIKQVFGIRYLMKSIWRSSRVSCKIRIRERVMKDSSRRKMSYLLSAAKRKRQVNPRLRTFWRKWL